MSAARNLRIESTSSERWYRVNDHRVCLKVTTINACLVSVENVDVDSPVLLNVGADQRVELQQAASGSATRRCFRTTRTRGLRGPGLADCDAVRGESRSSRGGSGPIAESVLGKRGREPVWMSQKRPSDSRTGSRGGLTELCSGT